ncbi:MAG: glycosyltransferase family 2 protein [Patescibacteria group bacterium]
MELSIVIINYNTKDLLAQCLDSLEESRHPSYEIIVVDNASTDGSAEMVEKKFPWAQVLRSPRNLGFSSGNNLAVPETRGRYVLFLNSDTEVPPETLPEMVRFMDSHPRAGAATCYIELPDGSMDINCHRGFPTPWAAFCHFSGLERLFPRSRLFSRYFQGWKNLDQPHEIDACEGAFMMVRRDAADSARVPSCGRGWWDEDFFFYGEDLDFCYRLRQAGWKVFYNPAVKIIHYAGASSGIKKGGKKVPWKTKARALRSSTQAMRTFYEKHYQTKCNPLLDICVFLAIGVLTKIRLVSGWVKHQLFQI